MRRVVDSRLEAAQAPIAPEMYTPKYCMLEHGSTAARQGYAMRCYTVTLHTVTGRHTSWKWEEASETML